MRVLIATGIYPPEQGGPSVYIHVLAGWLKAHGHEVCVITYGDERTRCGEGWSVEVVSRRGGAMVRYMRYASRVATRSADADVIYVQGAVSEGLPTAFVAWLRRVPLVLRIPGDYAWEFYQNKVGGRGELLDEFVLKRHGGAAGVLQRVERWVAYRAERIIVPSRYLKRIAVQWGIPAEKVSVVPNAVKPIKAPHTRDEARSRFGVIDRHVLLTVARAVPWKGVNFFLDVLAKLPPEFLYVVASRGPELEAWKMHARELGVEDRLRVIDGAVRETVEDWFQAADLFILPSGYEGFPHVVVEAVSVGLPCLVSDRAGNPEAGEMYPSLVHVVPYRDESAWEKACLSKTPRLAPLPVPTFDRVAEQALEILQKAAGR